MSYDVALTTVDNPFDPFEQFASWHLFDKEKGYNSCERLARVAQFSDEMTQVEIAIEKERAIDTIVMYDDADIYKKATKEVQSDEDEDDNEV